MPEFVMENRNEAVREESAFVFGFIEVLFFTETSPAYDSSVWFEDATQEAIAQGRSDGNIPGDCGYSDLHPSALADIRQFCEAWQAKHADLISRVLESCPDYDETQLGRDFFYVHVGHGVGFSDRDELAAFPDLIEELEDAAGYGEVSPHYGAEGDSGFVFVDLY